MHLAICHERRRERGRKRKVSAFPFTVCRHTLLGQSQWGFHECFTHIKYSATSPKFPLLHETLRREKERVSPR
jgi:hypothetical protein